MCVASSTLSRDAELALRAGLGALVFSLLFTGSLCMVRCGDGCTWAV